MRDERDGGIVKRDKRDEFDVEFHPNPRCKICRSPYVHEVNQMLIEGRPYSEIVAKFKDKIPGLTKQNISRHKKHFNFVKKGIEKYYEQLEEGAERVVDELNLLDKIIERMGRFVLTIDPLKKPRSLEVCSNTMFKAIEQKRKITGDMEDPSNKLLKLIEEALSEDEG